MSGEPSLGAKCVGEFLGTFLLIFTIGCNVLSGNAVWAGVSIACVLMVAVYSLGGISGANFNPAVTACLAITHSMGCHTGMDAKTAGIYCAVQLAGALCAGFAYMSLFRSETGIVLQPAKGFGGMEAGTVEMLYTFMLCFVVLNTAVANSTQYYGLAIGFVIVAGAYGAGAISGGCFNPAVAFGLDVSTMKPTWWFISYWIGQLAGAALAAVLFKVCRPDKFDAAASGPKPLQSKLVSEFLGTYFLVLTVGLNVLAKSPAGAFSIAAALMCMIYALGDVSGAHFNPAVTIAIMGCGRNKITPAEVGAYISAQIAGGIAAGFTYFTLYGASFPLGPVGTNTWGEVSVAESVFTFVLCFVVLSVAISEKTAAPEMFGLAIGSCVTVGGFAIGSISGGSLNPAVSAGIAVSHMSKAYNAIFYSIFEFAGACLAAGVFHVTHAVDLEVSSKPLSAEA